MASVVDFGAFVLIEDGIEGLLHVSEMRGTKDFAPQDVLVPGDLVLVRIVDIQPDLQRLALSQKRVGQTEEMEWTFRKEQQLLKAHRDEEE